MAKPKSWQPRSNINFPLKKFFIILRLQCIIYYRILSLAIEDICQPGPVPKHLEEKLKNAKLEILILCPVFIQYIIQYPEHGIKLAKNVRPDRVLAMLLGVEESTVSDDLKAG